MRIARGKVVGNSIVLEGEVLPDAPAEGSLVTVYLDEGAWDLDEASWRELDDARAAVARGESVADEDFDAELGTTR